MPELNFSALKARQRAERDHHPEGLGLRVHRALSWLQRAEQETTDLDAQFIFLWISFNAAYANPSQRENGYTEQAVFKRFLADLLKLDSSGKLTAVVWTQFPQAIRILLDNPYVYQPFWDARIGDDSRDEAQIMALWQPRFEQDKAVVRSALAKNDTLTVLMAIFSRLYTLRNQLLHGGATWDSQVNRDQLRDGARIMGQLVPIVIKIMLDSPSASWEMPMYPVVRNES